MTGIRSDVVEVVVFAHTAEGARVLVLRRAPDEPLAPGIWQIITGTLEGDEPAVSAALRELEEETGMAPLRMWTVPYVNSYFDRKRNAVQLMPWFAVEVAAGSPVRLSAEHQEHRWVTFDRAAEMMAWPGQRRGLRIVEQEIAGGGPASEFTLIPL